MWVLDAILFFAAMTRHAGDYRTEWPGETLRETIHD